MSIFGNIIGSTVGSVISGAINAATGGSSKPSSGSSSSSSSSASSSGSSASKPSSGGSSSNGISLGIKPPSDYQGGASYVTVYDKYQQAIKDQMNANSEKWWSATSQEERDQLHQQNQQLAAMLGGSVQYTNGVWHGDAANEQLPNYQLPSGQIGGLYTPQDQSQYLEEMYQAYLEKQKEALKQAYETNLSDLQAEQDKLGVNYQAARNDTAAQSALAQQRFNETANAYGLNSGTAGQAALSYSNQLQADISSLQAAESAANAEIERQRTNLSKQYQSALVQAQADNNYELFDALYQEAVRVDQALQQQSQFNAQQTLQQYQTLLDQYYNDKQLGFTQEQWQYQQQQDQYQKDLAAAELLAASGDYSAYGKLFGWDQSKIDQMNNAWKMANTITSSSGGRGGGGGSSGGGGSGGVDTPSISNDYEGLFKAAMASGYPESFIENNYKKYGFSKSTGLYDDYNSWLERNSTAQEEAQKEAQKQLDEILRQIDFYFGNNMDETAMKIIQNNWDKIGANPSIANQVKQKAKYFGYIIS
ncbi:hypothetical protein ACTQ33_01025 [Candidatus Avoscillospira sp. LCP25S3_F1]|uniref:hypothetical protein n=1 Tax=Candidatus Avoscillospira sp. LCP25S3_F1 TaxID=3438825 RepID=UPI003F93A339